MSIGSAGYSGSGSPGCGYAFDQYAVLSFAPHEGVPCADPPWNSLACHVRLNLAGAFSGRVFVPGGARRSERLIPLLVHSFILTGVYEYSGNIYISVAIHILYNLLSGAAYVFIIKISDLGPVLFYLCITACVSAGACMTVILVRLFKRYT